MGVIGEIVRVYLMGKYRAINLPKNISEFLALKPGETLKPIEVDIGKRTILVKEPGPVKIVSGGKGRVKLLIPSDLGFNKNDKLLPIANQGKLILEKVDYYIVKPTISPNNYFRINIPWELVKELGWIGASLIKIKREGSKLILELIK